MHQHAETQEVEIDLQEILGFVEFMTNTTATLLLRGLLQPLLRMYLRSFGFTSLVSLLLESSRGEAISEAYFWHVKFDEGFQMRIECMLTAQRT